MKAKSIAKNKMKPNLLLSIKSPKPSAFITPVCHNTTTTHPAKINIEKIIASTKYRIQSFLLKALHINVPQISFSFISIFRHISFLLIYQSPNNMSFLLLSLHRRPFSLLQIIQKLFLAAKYPERLLH